MSRPTMLLVAIAAFVAGIASAYTWSSGATGDWLDAGWNDPNPVWDDTADAEIYSGTVNLTSTSRPTNKIHNVVMTPSGGSAILNISGDLHGQDLKFSDSSGTATINQTAGTVDMDGWMYLGSDSFAANTYNLDGGTWNSRGRAFYLGYNGNNAMEVNVDGGTLTHSYSGSGDSYFYVGSYNSTTGTLNLADGTVDVSVARMDVGHAASAIGTFNQTGGLFEFSGTGEFILGHWDDCVGTLNVSGGTNKILSATEPNVELGHTSGTTGILNQYGGLVDYTLNDLRIGEGGGSTGIVHQTDGIFKVHASHRVYIGHWGTGTVNLDGGTMDISVDTETGIGHASSGRGTLNQTGGHFKFYGSDTLYVGHWDQAVGTINISGGTNEIDSAKSSGIRLGYTSGTKGVVNLSGGLLDYKATYFIVGQSGTGVVNQTGGRFELPTLVLANNSDGTGSYTISGGSFDASSYIDIKHAGSTFVVDGSGADSIETGWVLGQGGTLRFNLDAGGATPIEAGDDGVVLTNMTLEVDTLAGFSTEIGMAYDLIWTASTNGFNTNDLVFVDKSGTGFECRIVEKNGGQELQALVSGRTPSEKWSIDYGLTGDDALAGADPDGDGVDNLCEYAFGGDPTNAANRGIASSCGIVDSGGTNWLEYVYPKRSALDSGLTYYLELTDDLIYHGWTNGGYTVEGVGTINADFDAVTNRVPTMTDERFVRLIIEE